MSFSRGWQQGVGKGAGKSAAQQTYSGGWHNSVGAKWKCACGCGKNRADSGWCKHCGTPRSSGEVFLPREGQTGGPLGQGVLPPPGLHLAPW
eukprot:1292592-Pyramimonas_sp.AAC.1